MTEIEDHKLKIKGDGNIKPHKVLNLDEFEKSFDIEEPKKTLWDKRTAPCNLLKEGR